MGWETHPEKAATAQPTQRIFFMLFRSDDDWPSASSAVLCALGSASHQPCKVQSTTLGVESGYIVGTDHCHGSIELLQRMFKIFWVQFHVVAPTFFRNQNS